MNKINLFITAILLFSIQLPAHSKINKKLNSKILTENQKYEKNKENHHLFMIHFDEKKSGRLLKSKTLENEIHRLELDLKINIQPAFQGDLYKINEHIQKIENISKKKLLNPHLIYTTLVSNKNKISELIHFFQAYRFVESFYPYPKLSLSQIQNSPDLSLSQHYIEETNSDIAWENNLFGQNITIINFEYDFNPFHEDLQLNLNSFLDEPFCVNHFHQQCNLWKSHGTAVTGVIKGLHNESGINGISPQTDFFLVPVQQTLFSAMLPLIDSLDNDDIETPAIFMVQFQIPGTNLGSCNIDPRGCLPVSANLIDFQVMELASAMGITVVESAGNGSIDLDNENNYLPFHRRLIENNSDNITVAASRESERLAFSNCGSAIDVHAPGFNLSTTNFPFPASNLAWNPIDGIENFDNNLINSSYTNNFSGTSASTAVTAGIIALLQSRLQSLIGEASYLLPQRILSLIRSEENNDDCPIGSAINVENLFLNLDNYLSDLRNNHPFFLEIENRNGITEEDYFALRQSGIILICDQENIAHNHLSCPINEIINPENPNNEENPGELDDEIDGPNNPDLPQRGKYMDITGNGRSDLVIYDHYNLKVFEYENGFPENPSYTFGTHIAFNTRVQPWPQFYWPMWDDINNDSRSDLIVYEKTSGTFYIKIMDDELLEGRDWQNIQRDPDYGLSEETNRSFHWDQIVRTPWSDDNPSDINYMEADYSRPLLADYNQDGWVDLGLIDSTGHWNIKWNQEGQFQELQEWNITWDQSHRILNDETIRSVSTLGFIPIVIDNRNRSPILMGFKIPDSLSEEQYNSLNLALEGEGDDQRGQNIRGRIKLWELTRNQENNEYELSNYFFTSYIGDNRNIIYTGNFTINENPINMHENQGDIAIYNPRIGWGVLSHENNYQDDYILSEVVPENCFWLCYAFFADYDGDEIYDIVRLQSINAIEILASSEGHFTTRINENPLNRTDFAILNYFFGGTTFQDAIAFSEDFGFSSSILRLVFFDLFSDVYEEVYYTAVDENEIIN